MAKEKNSIFVKIFLLVLILIIGAGAYIAMSDITPEKKTVTKIINKDAGK